MPNRPLEIDCEEVRRLISNYLDDGVDPGLHIILTSHFKDCDHCRAVLDGTRNVVTLVGDGKAFKIPATTRKRFYKKLNDHLAASDRKAR